MEHTYSATTHGVTVTVQAFYLEDKSAPEDNQFFWAYRVRVTNVGAVTIQLLRRTWQITDATGRTIEVKGAGVVGEQPVLEAGESFEYTSGTPLETSSGYMTGKYHMVAPATGEAFDVAIPAFSLDSPHGGTTIH